MARSENCAGWEGAIFLRDESSRALVDERGKNASEAARMYVEMYVRKGERGRGTTSEGTDEGEGEKHGEKER